MRNNPSASYLIGESHRDLLLGIRHDKMTEKNWVSAWPALPPISMDEFEIDHDKALAELGISHDELADNGAIPVDMFQAHQDIISNFRYLYDDDDGFYGDDEDDVDGDDGDGNMYDYLYASRCMGNHTRYRRRMDELRTRARKISAGIGNVISESGSINSGFMYVRNQKLEEAMKEAKDTLEDAEYYFYLVHSIPARHSSAEGKLSQAKRNMFKLKRAFIKNKRASKNIIKLARHYSIYCAGYNRYLVDNWTGDVVASQDTVSKNQSDVSSENVKARKLHDTSEEFVVSYDMPSKNQEFVVSSISNSRVHPSHKKSTPSVTDVQPTLRVNMRPALLPSHTCRYCFGFGCF